MAKKVTYRPDVGLELITVSPILLVTSEYESQPNIITVSWAAPASFSPPVVYMAITPNSYSWYLIENSREFTINVPDASLLEEVQMCGKLSGRNRDKFMEAGLNKLKPLRTKAPLIAECFAHLECQIFRSFDVGDHMAVYGNIVSVLAEENIFTDDNVLDQSKKQTLHHLGARDYAKMGEKL